MDLLQPHTSPLGIQRTMFCRLIRTSNIKASPNERQHRE